MEIIKHSNFDYELIFEEQGSTIGNMIQKELLKNDDVKYAGYIVPHPLEKKMKIRIITKTKGPKEVLNNTFSNLVEHLQEILKLTDDIQSRSYS